jgi:predicted Zn-dependent protease with MMP-like domain
VGVRLSRGEFEVLVARALGRIPPRFRSRMVNLAILVEDSGPEPDLLGLYEGQPLTERSSMAAAPGPDRIWIFQRPHQEMARSAADLERIVADTVWHEVGHYFGLDESEIHAVEQRRERRRGLEALRRLRKR